jgi:hypothetical protein
MRMRFVLAASCAVMALQLDDVPEADVDQNGDNDVLELGVHADAKP